MQMILNILVKAHTSQYSQEWWVPLICKIWEIFTSPGYPPYQSLFMRNKVEKDLQQSFLATKQWKSILSVFGFTLAYLAFGMMYLFWYLALGIKEG